MTYRVRRARTTPSLTDNLDQGAWQRAGALLIEQFRPESSGHRPTTAAKLLYDRAALYLQFRVQDRYVRCVNAGFGHRVWEDSCVEWFVKPKSGKGYFNLELNCGGAFTCSYIEDPARTPSGFARSTHMTADEARQIRVHASMPGVLAAEIPGPVLWSVSAALPLSVLETYVGPLGDPSGQAWRGNFYKCADLSSHPHWGSWAPVGEKDFHRPQDFGTLRFMA